MDPFTGKKVWDVPIAASRSGVLSTAGGLVFMGGNGGLVAWDARTGAPLWHVNVGQNSSASPMTYMVGGRQYLTLPVTGMIVTYRVYD
jgi:outer membrane protein assembly factor BamB